MNLDYIRRLRDTWVLLAEFVTTNIHRILSKLLFFCRIVQVLLVLVWVYGCLYMVPLYAKGFLLLMHNRSGAHNIIDKINITMLSTSYNIAVDFFNNNRFFYLIKYTTPVNLTFYAHFNLTFILY